MGNPHALFAGYSVHRPIHPLSWSQGFTMIFAEDDRNLFLDGFYRGAGSQDSCVQALARVHGPKWTDEMLLLTDPPGSSPIDIIVVPQIQRGASEVNLPATSHRPPAPHADGCEAEEAERYSPEILTSFDPHHAQDPSNAPSRKCHARPDWIL
ncbi:hypothetical protein PV04_01646 [Phialophora macrospora]|uniref:Uncharacterized protein n=1 Tax=Phialophora macrospora TaxID=1851006 RepID=A0A0D2GME5_9EURO|nr:hypothetical protein PV04_01646 [Phialophora macrospora]